jgi:hypothetical protein
VSLGTFPFWPLMGRATFFFWVGGAEGWSDLVIGVGTDRRLCGAKFGGEDNIETDTEIKAKRL